MTKTLTPKQSLLAHLEGQHGYHQWSKKASHELLTKAHRQEHAEKHLTHTHKPEGWASGGDQQPVLIFLSPPKNPSASRNGDRNWTLTIAFPGHGWRYELPGTRAGDPEGAQDAAEKILCYTADWQPKGWGYEVKEDGTRQ